MADLRSQRPFWHLHHWLGSASKRADDGQLLERFVRQRDEEAFAELVARHGPLVLGLCRRLLGNVQDAEDVFQAAFFLLARKAGTIRKPQSLSCWLHGVAYRLALKARAETERRRRHERKVIAVPESADVDLSWCEVRGLLDEELQRLPEKQRLPLVLCYLEGRTQDEAARHLGWSRGTLKRRLEAGRERLRLRLTRRGVTLGAGLFAVALTASATADAVTPALRSATVRAGMKFLTHETAALVATPAVLLARGALQSMLTTKLKLGALLLLVMSCAVTAAALAIPQAPTEKQPENKVETPAPARPATGADDGKKRPDQLPPRRIGGFPRRALIISVHDYLYANPLQNGPPQPNAHNLNHLIEALANGLRVPFPQIAHLSDDAGPKMGARAPTKGIIEETLTKFLDSSRPQDRILVFFVGHSVEMGDDVYLAPIEGELDKPATLIPLKWFYEQLAKCKARQKVLVLDVNRYNQTFGQERPGSEEMGEKLDALLKAPPEGVQVWSSCSPKQRSYASDEYPMGIFLDKLEVVLQNGLQGKIQKEEEPLPLDFYVEQVNQMMKKDLSKRKLEQVSRLTGKAPKDGAAYDPKEASAPNAVTALARPPAAIERNKKLLKSILDQLGTPPIKGTSEMAVRWDAFPPMSAEALRQYQDDVPKPDSPLRKAVSNARAVLWAISPREEPKQLEGQVRRLRRMITVQLTVPRDGYRAPGRGIAETQFRNAVLNDERQAALLIRAVEDALEELTADPVKEARGSESKRWKANYDFMLARMQMELAYLFEYQSMLGSMRKEFPPRDLALHGGWKLALQPNLQGDAKGKKAAKEARKLLDKILADNAGSPWEVLAKRAKLTNLGLKWQPTR